MKNLMTNYLGLQLTNPIVAGASRMTSSAKKIEELAEAGVGAVVLHSLFEEQIKAELQQNIDDYQTDYPGAYDYVKEYTRESAVNDYLDLIRDAKKRIDIPVIASLNCVTAAEWTRFGKNFEQAGADALEINISLLPSDPRKSCGDYEQIYFDVINQVSKDLTIPISLKMSSYSSSLANLVSRLFWTGRVAGFVLFNRYYQPGINIDSMKLGSAGILSEPEEITLPLRWTALLSGMVNSDFASSTGVHDAEGAIKMLLAGTKAVQIVSTIYKNGIGRIPEIVTGIEQWMEAHSFATIEDFRGRLSYNLEEDQSALERIQFMKHYSGIS
jgi:dihydroorotate dehydrogenase (fumarate)